MKISDTVIYMYIWKYNALPQKMNTCTEEKRNMKGTGTHKP